MRRPLATFLLLLGLLFAGLASPVVADDASWLAGHAMEIDAGDLNTVEQVSTSEGDADRDGESKVVAEHHCMCVATIEKPNPVQTAPAPTLIFLGWAGSALESLAAPPLAEPPSA